MSDTVLIGIVAAAIVAILYWKGYFGGLIRRSSAAPRTTDARAAFRSAVRAIQAEAADAAADRMAEVLYQQAIEKLGLPFAAPAVSATP